MKADFEKTEIYEATLHGLISWGDAYPKDIFREPDLDRARAALEAAGMTLDGVAASCMRHVAESVAKAARKALEEANG